MWPERAAMRFSSRIVLKPEDLQKARTGVSLADFPDMADARAKPEPSPTPEGFQSLAAAEIGSAGSWGIEDSEQGAGMPDEPIKTAREEADGIIKGGAGQGRADRTGSLRKRIPTRRENRNRDW